MTISLKTRKMLWGRSGGLCAICKKRLFEDESETDDPSVLGEECHIVAREKDGPRGDDPLPEEKRDLFANLILLCLEHHKIIDDQPDKYTVVLLNQIKADHLKWFQETTGPHEAAEQKDIEFYAAIADEWATRAALNDWESFSFGLLSEDQPEMSLADFKRIEELRTWLFTRVWPKRIDVLEEAFENFLRVLSDLHELFRKRAEDRGEGLITRKFYKIEEWDDERYNRLLAEYNHHVGLVQDLAVELTRAANLVCDRIREKISPGFRRKEGIVLARQGIGADGHDKQLKLGYRPEERAGIPYPGLEAFMKIRTTRSFYYGDQQ
jgi:hypothetical protein